jgi:hypothetical protein
MDAIDRREFDRIYTRLLGQWSAPGRKVDTLSIDALQALMDRVRKDEATERETDRMNPADYPVID